MADLVMPRLSDTMEEGTILRWLVPSGEPIRRGQELVEIETDKANMVYESDLEGILEILAAEGDTLPVGAVIARVGSPVGDGNGAGATTAASASAAAATPPANPAAPAPTSVPTAASAPAPAGQSAPQGERVKASPLARRIAHERHVDLHDLTGSGPGGRIVKADVQAAATAEPSAATGAVPSPSVPGSERPSGGGLAGSSTAKGETRELELSRTQQTIARRMAESKATIPHFALETEIDMQECVALRSQLKQLAGAGDDAEVAPTYNDMVVKACALALREHPRANSSYRDGRLQLHGRVNVGVAVAVDSARAQGGALIVPTVFDADLKSLGEVARETRALAARVREGSITPPELSGATFTVSNLGMFGIARFTAIINPPQAAILAVGSVAPRPVAREGEVLVRHTMNVTLACDHRILYGADAAGFLARIRELLQQPASLTL